MTLRERVVLVGVMLGYTTMRFVDGTKFRVYTFAKIVSNFHRPHIALGVWRIFRETIREAKTNRRKIKIASRTARLRSRDLQAFIRFTRSL